MLEWFVAECEASEMRVSTSKSESIILCLVPLVWGKFLMYSAFCLMSAHFSYSGHCVHMWRHYI